MEIIHGDVSRRALGGIQDVSLDVQFSDSQNACGRMMKKMFGSYVVVSKLYEIVK